MRGIVLATGKATVDQTNFKLEDDFEMQNVGVKTQPQNLDPNLQNKISKIANGKTDLTSLWEESARSTKEV
jgi:hypothetical protein